MSRATAPRPAPSHGGQDLGDEYLFYDRERDEVHVLNAGARAIFLLCDGARSEAEIAEAFAGRYDAGTRATARADALRTIEQLVELGVLVH